MSSSSNPRTWRVRDASRTSRVTSAWHPFSQFGPPFRPGIDERDAFKDQMATTGGGFESHRLPPPSALSRGTDPGEAVLREARGTIFEPDEPTVSNGFEFVEPACKG